MANLHSSLERGLPVSLSRWTDVAHWYMPWLQEMVCVNGVIPASDPQSVTLRYWKADPDNIHSFFFWTKYPPKLTQALRTWLSPYRVFTAVTITGWEEVETRVPPLEEQLRALEDHIALVGPDLVQWRYSPVPNDFLDKRKDQFEALCDRIVSMGLTSVDVSFLQPSPHWDKGYTDDRAKEGAARKEIFDFIVRAANSRGIGVGVCADDLALLPEKTDAQVYETRCLDRRKLDKVFGLETPEILENGCGCQLSLDPCNGPQFGCASACKYCYVSFTNTGT